MNISQKDLIPQLSKEFLNLEEILLQKFVYNLFIKFEI